MPARRDLLLALACGALPGVGAAAPLPVALRLERRVFGSPADLMLARRGDATAVAAGEAVFAALQRLNDRWNAWKPGELTALNAGLRAGRSVEVSPALAAAIRGAAALESASAGLFNPAIGRAIGGWGFHDDVLRPGSPPARAEHARWQRQRPSLVQLEWQGSLLRSRNPWLQIDLGAYAKGIAADWALDRLRASGIDDALVNLGGNLAAMGQGAQGPWRVGIRDPFGGGLLASLQTREREAVVTSGTYERYRVLDGSRYGHVLDPLTAAPAGGLVSVTVVHPSAALADAAATALLVAGRGRWRAAAARLDVREALIVDARGDGEVTPALAPRLQWTAAAWRRAVTVV